MKDLHLAPGEIDESGFGKNEIAMIIGQNQRGKRGQKELFGGIGEAFNMACSIPEKGVPQLRSNRCQLFEIQVIKPEDSRSFDSDPEIPFITTPKAELEQTSLQTLRRQFLETLLAVETKRAHGRDISAFLKHLKLEDGNLGDIEKRGLPDLYGSLYEFLQSFLKRDECEKHVINQKAFNRIPQGNASFFKYLQKFYGFPFNLAAYIKKLRELDKSNTPELTEDEVIHLLWSSGVSRKIGSRQAYTG